MSRKRNVEIQSLLKLFVWSQDSIFSKGHCAAKSGGIPALLVVAFETVEFPLLCAVELY